MGQIRFCGAELIGRAEAYGAGLIRHSCGAQCGNMGQNGIDRAQRELWSRGGFVEKDGIYGAEAVLCERRRAVGQREFCGIE